MKNNKCTICKKQLSNVLDLGLHPCADTFLKKKSLARKLKKYPLQVGFCSCNHLTSIYKILPSERYTKYNYSYTSNNSPVSRNHFKNISRIIIKKFKLTSRSHIIEIGSNDGTFLKYIKQQSNVSVLGVDPSKFMCKIAKKRGIKTYANFFDLKNSRIIKNKFGKFDILYAANVFNHIEDPNNFLRACDMIIKDNGIIILEVPDLDSLINTCGFDTIYHEHRQYFSSNSIKKILYQNKYEVLSIKKINYMSGSLRVFAKKNNELKKINIETNFQKKIYADNFENFKKRVFLVKAEILRFISKYNAKNKIIIGIAAATKGNTLLNFCGINYHNLKCIIENSPYKINKFTPGSAIPIVNEKKFKKFDAALILPWNITRHLYKKFLQNKKIPYTSVFKVVKKLNKCH